MSQLRLSSLAILFFTLAHDANLLASTNISKTILTVCAFDFPPIIFQNQRNVWQGYEVDILQEVAKETGVLLEYKAFAYDQIWLRPLKGECDVTAAGLTVDSERIDAGAVFSHPHFNIDQSLLIRKEDFQKIQSLKMLDGHVIGVMPGTTGALFARQNAPDGAIFQEYLNEDNMIQALRDKNIDAIARGTPGNRYQASLDAGLTVTGVTPTNEHFAFATSTKKSHVLNAINEVIERMTQSGQLETLRAKWNLLPR